MTLKRIDISVPMLAELSDSAATLAPAPSENGDAPLPIEDKEIAFQIAREFSFSRHQAERIVARVLGLASSKKKQ